MKTVDRVLLFLHLLVGIGAMGGGLAAILNPQTPLGIGTEHLQSGPFTDFLIPGIFLFAVLGIGDLAAAFLIIRKARFRGYSSGVMGGTLVLWIVVQCIILNDIAFLHVLFFAIGALIGMLSLAQLYHFRQFPMNIMRQYIRKRKA